MMEPEVRSNLPGSHVRISAAVAATAMMWLASCGLPGGGETQRIDDDTVPYQLLESAPPAAGSSTKAGEPRRVPVVFWLDGNHLTPEATDDSCADRPDLLVKQLLGGLAAGPSDDARAAGRSSALPSDSGLDLVGIVDGTAEVEIEPETSLSAEMLPVAVGQVVLTITSAPTVQSVALVSDGKPLQVPLPGGVLTDGPVTDEDYADLLPDRYQGQGTFGCPQP
jgi:hypothetical protein